MGVLLNPVNVNEIDFERVEFFKAACVAVNISKMYW